MTASVAVRSSGPPGRRPADSTVSLLRPGPQRRRSRAGPTTDPTAVRDESGCGRVGRLAALAGAGVLATRLASSLVEPERRVDVGHQARVHDDAQHPPVQADEEVEDPARIASER